MRNQHNSKFLVVIITLVFRLIKHQAIIINIIPTTTINIIKSYIINLIPRLPLTHHYHMPTYATNNSISNNNNNNKLLHHPWAHLARTQIKQQLQ